MSLPLRRLAIGVAALALLAACGPPKPPAIRNVAVRLDWATDGVALAGGHGTFTTDLGYTVEADRFELTAYAFEFVPCNPPPPRPPGQLPGGTPPRRTSFSFIGTAWAGHRTDHPPTLTDAHRVEKPLLVSTQPFDALHVPDVTYCTAHYLIGRLPDTGIDPADTGNIGVSLRIHGRYRKGDAAWTDFAVETPVAHGILVDLKKLSANRKGLRVKDGDTFIVTRQLSRAFNGVDFAAVQPPELARQVLREVVASATVTRQPAE